MTTIEAIVAVIGCVGAVALAWLLLSIALMLRDVRTLLESAGPARRPRPSSVRRQEYEKWLAEVTPLPGAKPDKKPGELDEEEYE